MFRSKFSASVESFLSSASSSSSVSVERGCSGCEQGHSITRRPFFRRSFPSMTKPHIRVTPLVWVIYLPKELAGLRTRLVPHFTFIKHLSKGTGAADLHGVQQSFYPWVSLGHGCIPALGLSRETDIPSSHFMSRSEHRKKIYPHIIYDKLYFY
ncbi:hypothetical protein BJ322DRAFT_1017376 [Thelephora terrestris]|uniref:Uncharacterized protein n=1 Tax=Thelephora terrestris TaxID=56493 RepID=A0A9P6HP32_9AGAM|nr:hypothetical protein BJ322DRAFT_1017376 [Thelephora terrestris]